MADYNYHRPDIVGMEWVPIKNASYQPDHTVELGYTFSVAPSGSPIVPRRGIYYVNDLPTGVTVTQVPVVSLYTADSLSYGQRTTTQTFECEFASETGDGVFINSTGADALVNSSDNKYYRFGSPSTTGTGTLTARFNVGSITGMIHNVSLVYAASGDLATMGTSPNSLFVYLRKGAETPVAYGTGVLDGPTELVGDTLVRYGRISLGNIDPHGPFTAGGAFTTNERIAWNSDNLVKFKNAASPQYSMEVSWNDNTAGECRIHYMALEVTVSFITMPVLMGGFGVGYSNVGTSTPYALEENYVNLYAYDDYPAVTGTALMPGDYTVTFRLGDLGDLRSYVLDTPALTSTNSRPTINAQRELYQEPPIRGVEIHRPQSAREQLTVNDSYVIPTVGITTTGSPTLAYPGCHGYDAQALYINLSVFASISQDFASRNRYGPLPYPWFRMYARRLSGTTCVGLRVEGPDGSFATITGEDFDELPEIVDGWKEVTLRFESPSPVPVLDATSAVEQFFVRYEPNTIGNLFQEAGMEVLGASSDFPLIPATYQSDIGAFDSDISFLFSTDPPAVTGLAVTPKLFPVAQVGIECGSAECCIPTGVPYNHVTWSIPNFQTEVFDSFDRTLVSSWGNANTGQSWINLGGAGSDYSVTGSAGIHTITSTNVARHSVTGALTLRDFDATTVVRMPPGVSVTGSPWSNSILGRFADVNNYYRFQAEITTNEPTFNISIIRRSGGSDTTLTTALISTFLPGVGVLASSVQNIAIRASAQGPILRMKIWNADDQTEPGTWQLTVTDSTFTTGLVGVRTIVNSGSLNTLPLNFAYSVFWNSPLLDNFGTYELQRRDDYTDWQTILAATSPGVTGFYDSEARIGVRSEYRIRETNVHRFTGPWSATVTGTAINPASSLCGDTEGHELLVFTTNADQSGTQVLAYEQVWENQPSNEMTYFEGEGMMQFQRMYDRDFQVGFHAEERGGVQFTRMLLVQNAVVSPPVLEDAFLTLRDLAWANVPYVCVRTSNGDRWFAAVEVPSGSISRRRRLQLVQVRVTQVSEESYVADPPLWFADTLRSELPCRAQQAPF